MKTIWATAIEEDQNEEIYRLYQILLRDQLKQMGHSWITSCSFVYIEKEDYDKINQLDDEEKRFWCDIAWDYHTERFYKTSEGFEMNSGQRGKDQTT